MEVLQSHAPAHLTAAQVYERIQARLPAVNPSTVYRALERLAKAGQISVSDMGGGAAVYEAFSNQPHHHLVCQMCGTEQTLDHAPIRALFAAIEQQHGYTIVTNHLVLFGICPDCQSKISGSQP